MEEARRLSGSLDDPSVPIEKIAAPEHVEDAAGVPVEPLAGGGSHCTNQAQRRDAAVHPFQVHRIDQVGPLESAAGVVNNQRRPGRLRRRRCS